MYSQHIREPLRPSLLSDRFVLEPAALSFLLLLLLPMFKFERQPPASVFKCQRWGFGHTAAKPLHRSVKALKAFRKATSSLTVLKMQQHKLTAQSHATEDTAVLEKAVASSLLANLLAGNQWILRHDHVIINVL